jgi:tripartite-type tricarboxylate transporter receptor subunit TctC
MNALGWFYRTLLALGACTVMAVSHAQEWPKSTIKLVVPFPPGGASDIVARLIAPAMSEKLKQSVIVENRPGGGTAIGAKSVITSTDGHTFFVSNSAPISIAPLLFDTPPYDPMKDFAHIGMVGVVPNAFFVSSTIPVDNMTQYVAWVKAQGKAVPYGSGGGGSIGHIVGEMFKNELGLQMDHVAYKGSAPMFQDVMGGHISVGVNTLPEVWELAKAGRLKVLAVTSPARAKIAPNVPSVTELGYGKLVAENFVGLSGPASTPPAVTARMNAVLNEALGDPRVSAKLEELGFGMSKLTPAAFTSYVQKQVTDFNPVVKASGAKLN